MLTFKKIKDMIKRRKDMVQIRCYNVIFRLECHNESEYYKIDCFGKRLQNESMKMMEIFKWCNVQGIKYRTRFIYRRDFPLRANVWNLYTYIRGTLENRYIYRHM
jgi:hypothetical protein